MIPFVNVKFHGFYCKVNTLISDLLYKLQLQFHTDVKIQCFSISLHLQNDDIVKIKRRIYWLIFKPWYDWFNSCLLVWNNQNLQKVMYKFINVNAIWLNSKCKIKVIIICHLIYIWVKQFYNHYDAYEFSLTGMESLMQSM